MEQTSNYQLNQWDKTDHILMEDFNPDNAKLEQVLAGMAGAQSEMQTALVKCGNCKIVYGSYTGNGTYGSENHSGLTFDLMPIYVVVIPSFAINNKSAVILIC